MNKYELALVVSANVEDEVRTATIEKVNELITRFGGTITDPGTSEKKKPVSYTHLTLPTTSRV